MIIDRGNAWITGDSEVTRIVSEWPTIRTQFNTGNCQQYSEGGWQAEPPLQSLRDAN
jgi:hypothetical protein